MSNELILLIDGSRESEEALKLLEENNIIFKSIRVEEYREEHVSLLTLDHHYEGLRGIKYFVESSKEKEVKMETADTLKHDGLRVETLRQMVFNTALLILPEADAKEFVVVVFSQVTDKAKKNTQIWHLMNTLAELHSNLKTELVKVKRKKKDKHLKKLLQGIVIAPSSAIEEAERKIEGKISIISVLMKLLELLSKDGKEVRR